MNCLNRKLLRADNVSGYAGVSIVKKTGRWKYNVSLKGNKPITKTPFNTPKEAAIARDLVIIKYNYPHKLNFPELRFGIF